MAYTGVWWHRPWVRTTESVLGHVAAVIIGFIMMVIGLALGVTMVMLPVGLVIGLIGVAMVVGGLFARFGPND
jgi:archaellum biogenesis protein FlaJ (TadC family)